MTNEERKEVHASRLRNSKLSTVFKQLKSYGLTVDDIVEYAKKTGFKTKEDRRNEKILAYRRRKQSEKKRVVGLEKARAAKKQPSKKIVEGLG